MAKKVQDNFANMASMTLIESAANTLTYKKLETSIGTFDKIAWVIHRIEYMLYMNSTCWNSTDDSVSVALMVGNQRTSIVDQGTFIDPTIIDYFRAARNDFGAAASGFLMQLPFVKDFTSLPGGGLIIPPAPVYGAVHGVGLATAGGCIMRLYYTVKELSTEEYWELVEARRLLTA